MSLNPLSRDSILALKPRTRSVDVPAMSGSVTVRELTMSEAHQFSQRAGADAPGSLAYLVTTAAVTPDGAPLFQPTDAAKVAALPFAVVNAVADAVLDLSGLKETAEKKRSDAASSGATPDAA